MDENYLKNLRLGSALCNGAITINPQDYVEYVLCDLQGNFTHSPNVATIATGCVGTLNLNGTPVLVYTDSEIPFGCVSVGR